MEPHPKKDVVAEISVEFDIDELLTAREKLYERALKKAKAKQRTDDVTGPLDKEKNCKLTSPRISKYIEVPWKLIKRRITALAAIDVCEIYIYLIEEDGLFPSRILKRKPLTPNLTKAEIASKQMEIIVESDEDRGNVSRCASVTARPGEREDGQNRENNEKSMDASVVSLTTNGNQPQGAMVEMSRTTVATVSDNNISPHVSREDNPVVEPDNGGEPAEENDELNADDNIITSEVDKENGVLDEEKDENIVDDNIMNLMPASKNINRVIEGPDIADIAKVADNKVTAGAILNTDTNADSRGDKSNMSMSEKILNEVISKISQATKQTPMNNNNDIIRLNMSSPCSDIGNRSKQSRDTESSVLNRISNIPDRTTNDGTKIVDNKNDKMPEYNAGGDHLIQKNNSTSEAAVCNRYNMSRPQVVHKGATPIGNRSHEVHANEPRSRTNAAYVNEGHDKVTKPTNIPRSTAVVSNRPQPATDSANEFLDGTDISQASFLQEILEIHSRVTSSSPRKVECCCKQKKKSVNMATQTSVNIVDDVPVMKSEFECHTACFDRALTNHERRTRSIEIWQKTVEGQVARTDADSHNNHLLLQTAFEMVVEELRDTKEIVGKMVDQANDREDAFERMVQRDIEREEILAKLMESSCKCKSKEDPDPTRGRESKEKSSSYDSFMKAARKVVGPFQPNKPDTEGSRGQITRREPKGPAELEKPAEVRDEADCTERAVIPETPTMKAPAPAQQPCTTSTPLPARAADNISWADEVEEDSAVDDFFASVVISNGNPPTTNIPDVKAAEPDQPSSIHIPGLKPVPDLRRYQPTTVQEKAKVSATTTRQDNNQPDKPDNAAAATGGRSAAGVNTRQQPTRKIAGKPGTGPSQAASNRYGILRDELHPSEQNDNNNAPPTAPGNGARPKNTISGESMRFRDNVPKSAYNNKGRDNGKGAEAGRKSYAEVAGKYDWQTPMSNNKRKRINSSPKEFKPISGTTIIENKDIYVRGLATRNFSNSEELEDSVRYYCRERGVNIVFARVMTNNVNTNAVGCRICLREEDLDKVYEDGFWPAKVEIREWYNKPRERRPSKSFFNGGANFE